jgi:hypothetical protein
MGSRFHKLRRPGFRRARKQVMFITSRIRRVICPVAG